MLRSEKIIIEGSGPIPSDVREQINDVIHAELEENEISPGAVFWE